MSGLAQRKTRKTARAAAGKKAATTKRKKKRSTPRKTKQTPLLKYEIIGLLSIGVGIFLTISFFGVDTGSLGRGLDTLLSYGFGVGRIAVTIALVWAGIKYITKRKAWPFSWHWGIGIWLYVLALTLIHVLEAVPDYEFTPIALQHYGGFVGAVITTALRQFVGQVGAILVIFGLFIVTVLLWQQWSISKPVAMVSDKASEEVGKISNKAVTGLQEASQSIMAWHERRKIFDQQKEEDDEPKQSLTEPVPSQPEPDDAGVEEVPLPTYQPEAPQPEAATEQEDEQVTPDNPYDWADAIDADNESAERDDDAQDADVEQEEPERPVETAVTQTEDVLGDDMQDLQPIKVEQTAAAADMDDDTAPQATTAPTEHPYELPPMSMLHHGPQQTTGVSDEVRQNARILQDTLQSFNIDAKILNASQGPAVTRYELEPAAGVKVSKIVHLADDLALKLAATDIRIEAPIPGKAAVGIEVPNKKLSGVTLRDVIDTDAFKLANHGVPVCLGKDISGTPVIADLTKMPHLLVAGSTGSGKSVCINTFIASILFKQRPEDVKLILVDPKVVELSNYNGIPHLLTPVVTDPKKAASVLRWAVREMDDRYKRFALTKTRDITRYNELHPDEKMPFIILIIDELADLMMTAASDVEDSICRLAQKARACGMHLVLATQRPSVDVLTGLIKANVPSRIAFAVSSLVDSRCILDMAGAERLIGKGDMLFAPMGSSKPIRVQGAFISDSEIDAMVEFIKKQGQPEYDEAVQKAQSDNAEDGADFFEDDLMPQAIEIVLETGQASASMLQRRFRVGYTRAARMVDMMEAMHIVGPSNGSKPREIIMTPEEVQQKYLQQT